MKKVSKKASVAYEKLDKAQITRWPLLAAALSYYSSLAVVPFLAICVAIAKGLKLDNTLWNTLSEYFSGQDEILKYLKDIVDKIIDGFSGGLLALGALVLIFWSAYRLLGHLENIFGQIYGYRPPRRAMHRAGDYLTITLIVPFLLIAVGVANFSLMGLGEAKSVVGLTIDFKILIGITPYIVWWMVLTWAYAYFSRGLMLWRERLIGGLISSIIFQLFQTLFFHLAFKLTSYNAIYGSFAIVPLFLMWLYYSWIIIILGAEITRRFADKFLTKTSLLHLPEPETWEGIKNLSLQIMAVVRKNYNAVNENGDSVGEPTNMRELALATNSTLPVVGEVVNRLMAINILSRISGPNFDDKGPTFVTTMSCSVLTDEYLIELLESSAL